MVQRLPSTSDTAAGAGHNLYGVVLVAPMPDIIKKMARIAKPVGYPDLQFKTIEVDSGPAYSLHPPYSLEIDIL